MNPSAGPDIMSALVLEDHLLLLNDVERVIQEENGLLKQTGQPPDDAFIRRKSRLVPRLNTSLDLLRANGRGRVLPLEARDFLCEAQRKLHKLLLLDRENEALLLRSILPAGPAAPGARRIGHELYAKTYGSHLG